MADPTVGSRAEVEIALRDSLSPGLRAMARDIRALNRSIKSMSDDGETGLSRVSKSTTTLSVVTRTAVRDLTVMGSFMTGFTKGLVGSLGTAAAIEGVVTAINNLAKSRVQLLMFSHDTKFATNDIHQMRGAMARMGIDAKTADGFIGQMGTKLQELGALRQGSSLFQDLQKMGPGGVELANRMMGNVQVGKHKEAMKDLVDTYKRQGPEAKFYMSQILGIPQSVLENMEEYRRKVRDTFQGNEQDMQKYLDSISKLKEYGSDQFTRYASHVVAELNKILTAMDETGNSNALSDWLIKDFDNVMEKARATREELEAIGNFFKNMNEAANPESAKSAIQERFGKFGVGTGPDLKSRLDQSIEDLEKEQSRVLLDIRDILRRQEERETAGRDKSGYGTGIRQEGGAAQASMGGFRPQRYGAGTRADRNNNPGNIEYGDFAKRMGAVGSDGRFAIFPDRETGFKAAEALLGGKGYEGLTLAQIGNKWANGDARWAQTVSRATGIPLGTVPTAEQRSQIARTGIPYAEGTAIGGEDAATGRGGGIPASILAEARKAALSGGPQAVYDYIRKAGYNVHAAWCGDFAAAVVKSAGGTPPKNPQVASNWRTWGREVSDPQPGDVAVRRGVPTGSTGSHVTFVDSVTGERFMGTGGNQSRPRASFPLSQFQFYRGDQAAARESIDRENKRPSVFELGTAAVRVDFGNVPPGVKTAAEGTGVFKELRIQRENQSPKAGTPPGDDFGSRWYFQ